MSSEDVVAEKLAEMDALTERFNLPAEEKQAAIQTLEAEVEEVLQATEAKRALVCFRRGWAKFCVADPEHSDEAMELLSKAVKLDPSMCEAWNVLGRSYWNKHDLAGARNCFKGSLQHGKNQESMYRLSTVLRSLPASSPEEKVENVKESVKLAKEALALDVKSDRAWMSLGMAYLSQLFSNVAGSSGALQSSLKAFNKAASFGGPVSTHPDLYNNRGIILKFLEEYEQAAADFTMASELDPALSCTEQLESIRLFVSKVAELIATKHGIKKKKLPHFSDNLGDEAYTSFTKGRVLKMLDELAPGDNTGSLLIGRFIAPVSRDESVPLSFIIVCQDRSMCLVSVYQVTEGLFEELSSQSVVHIFDPLVLQIDPGQVHSSLGHLQPFRAVHVLHPKTLFINGQQLSDKSVAPITLTIARSN